MISPDGGTIWFFVLIIAKFRKKGGKTFEEWDRIIRNSTNQNSPAVYNMEIYNRVNSTSRNSTNRNGTNRYSTNRNSTNQNRTNRNRFGAEDWSGGDSGGASFSVSASYSGCAGGSGG